jgi:diamine N-acetyltransferase
MLYYIKQNIVINECKGESIMIVLKGIDEENYNKITSLKIHNYQENFVPPAVNIMARAYAWRKKNAIAYAIYKDQKAIGIVLTLEEKNYYVINQFLIDSEYQNLGYGEKALLVLIDLLRKEKKYNSIHLSVIKTNTIALKLYKKLGFSQIDFYDPNKQDSIHFEYVFKQ